MLKVGTKAPDFTLDQAGGHPVSLSQVLQGGHHVLLIFLRHLA